ncbi:MAG: VOC family protein [Brevinematales bacterium]|jgi:predicted enzyme related to lactoylglutathione lyase
MNPAVRFELPANDMKRAESFYERVFGWDIDSSYRSFYWALTTKSDDKRQSLNPGEINGAIQFKDKTITSTRIDIRVPDLDDALKKVLAEGGKVFIPKKEIPGYYYAVINDTEGNEIFLSEKIK